LRFHVVHKMMSYLLAVAAVLALLCTGTVPLLTTGLLLVTGVLSWFVEPTSAAGRLVARGSIFFNVLALGFFAVSLFDVVRSFPEPDLTPILNLVLFLLVYKLFHRRSNRDYLQLYILSFLVVLAGAWLAQTVLYVVAFAGYVVLATWTLILFHLRHEIEDNYLVKHLPEATTEKVTAARVLNSRRVVGKAFFLVTGVVALAVLTGAALVFASVPRIGLGFLTGAVRRRMSFIGFSDEVKLGQHGVLSSDNDTVVLRVQVPRIAAIRDEEQRERAVGTAYWRGTVYDRYVPPTSRKPDSEGAPEAAQWIRTRTDATRTVSRLVPTREGSELHLVFPAESARISTSRALEGADMQIIQVVALSYPVAFALDHPVAFEKRPPAPGSFITTDFSDRWGGEVALKPVRLASGGQYLPLPEFTGGQYVAWSRTTRGPLDAGKQLADLEPEQLDSYLAVPPSTSPEVRRLAERIVGDRALPLAKVLAVMDWLKQNKRYTTDLKRDPKVLDPLEDFLFHQPAGHCEYFASAAAILLRIAKVPTRYVNGFLGGEWNEFSKHITVRDNRAHSWIEAYLGAGGWMRVDATPVSARVSRMGRVRQLFDSIELFWSRWVIQYDASRQLDLAKRLGRQLGMERSHGKRSAPLKIDYKLMAELAGIAVGLAVAWRYRRRLRRWSSPRSSQAMRGGPPVYRLYGKAVDRLSARGWPRGPSETPREFAERLVKSHVPGAEVMFQLTRHYAAARYGDHEVPAEVLSEIGAALDEVGRPRPAAPRPAA
jgi:protein-glutamine gamma-glutamyltransferase